jgi:hypothetical protein
MTNQEAAALSARADQLNFDLLTARASGPAVQRALERDSIPNVDLGAAAEKNIGAVHDAPSGLKVATGGPVTASTNSLSTLGGTTRRLGQESAGREEGTPGPTLRVDTTAPPPGASAVSDADRVVASLRSRFRRCYQEGLASDPTMSGKAVIVAKVEQNGEVRSADVASHEGLSSGVTSCLARVVSGAHFTYVGSGSATTLRIPISLIQQK